MKTASAELSLDLGTVSALSGAERTTNAVTDGHRMHLRPRDLDSSTTTRHESATPKVAGDDALPLRLTRCIRESAKLRPSPVGWYFNRTHHTQNIFFLSC